MSSYNGRRGPNVSQYIANLNTIPAAQDFPSEPLNLDEDLALFTNSEFIDWDGGDLDFNAAVDFDPQAEQQRHRLTSSGTKTFNGSRNESEAKPMDFLNSDFQFADFAGFQNLPVDPSIQTLPQQPNAYPVAQPYTSPVSTSVSPVSPHFEQPTGKKRKLDNAAPSQQAIDEAARVAAEEDKRRRNTAASARFRVKKKQREQALEKTAKEMTEKVSLLESKVNQLETENTWLKSLLMEKNGKNKAKDGSASRKSSEDNVAERSTSERTDGVGTGSKDLKTEA